MISLTNIQIEALHPRQLTVFVYRHFHSIVQAILFWLHLLCWLDKIKYCSFYMLTATSEKLPFPLSDYEIVKYHHLIPGNLTTVFLPQERNNAAIRN